FERADVGAQIFVFEIATAGEPGSRREQKLERPAVAHALAEIPVAVGVGVDKAGMQELVARVDHDSVGRRRKVGRPDFLDGVADHQHVGEFGAGPRGIDHSSTANDGFAFLGHGSLLHTVCLSKSTAQGKNARSTITTIWNSTIPMSESSTSAPQASGTRK